MERLQYSVDLDDIVAFNQFHASQSPTYQRSWRRERWIYPPIFAGLAILWIMSAGRMTASSLAILLLAVAWPVLVPRYLRWRLTRYVRRMYSEGSNASLIGVHEAVTLEDALAVTTPGDDTKIRWSAIGRVLTTPDYGFMYMSATQAVIIPRRTIVTGDFQAFMDDVHRHTSQVPA